MANTWVAKTIFKQFILQIRAYLGHILNKFVQRKIFLVLVKIKYSKITAKGLADSFFKDISNHTTYPQCFETRTKYHGGGGGGLKCK